MLRKLALTFFMMATLPSAAAPFGLETTTGAQKEFAALIEKSNWTQALAAWNQAYSGLSFAQTANGQALHSYLMLQNALPVMATENVLRLNAKDIHPELLALWKTELKKSTLVQKSWLSADKSWSKHIGVGEISIALSNKSQVTKALKYANALPKDMLREKTLALWQVATRAPLINETTSAIQALKKLQELSQNIIGQDQISLAMARVLYQKGDIDQALTFFHQVPKSSDLWLESVEERAWAHLRNSNYERSLGEVTTILAPTFDKLVGPEPYFLSNLLSLKICDYPRIFKVGELFKLKNRNRLTELQNIASQGTNKAIPIAFEQIDKKGVSLAALGPQAEFLPRAILKDRQFIKNMQYRHLILQESKIAQALLAKNATLGSNGELEKLVQDSVMQSDQARSRALIRVRQLATAETKEFKQILNKMHIVEAEVIQRLNMDGNLKGERNKLAKTEDKGNVLVFQYTDEVWLDELDNYKARVKDCPTLKGASL